MSNILEIVDKSGRKIRLTKERWSHIRQDHPLVEEDEITQTLTKPEKTLFIEGKNKVYFFRYFRHKKLREKYLRVVVKYLNGEGFILTAHFVKQIK